MQFFEFLLTVLLVSRIAIDETVVEKPAFMAKDADALDMETSSSKKVGRSRTKNIKVEFLPDSVGADTDADQSGQGVTTREEKVSSLKTVSSFLILILILLIVNHCIKDIDCKIQKQLDYIEEYSKLLCFTFKMTQVFLIKYTCSTVNEFTMSLHLIFRKEHKTRDFADWFGFSP